MTVGAVIVAADAGTALADAAGRPAIRRIIDAAWAGGALPIVVVAPDVEGTVAATLIGTPALLVDPGTDGEVTAAAQGLVAAVASVAEMGAILLWPAHMTWVDPETVTSLIEASGTSAVARRPALDGAPGWPLLVPVALAEQWLVGAGALGEALARQEVELIELGDPGSVLGLEVGLDDLPAYVGPPEPVGGPPPEWGAAAAEVPDPEG